MTRLLFFLLALASAPVFADRGPRDAREVETFVDGAIQSQLAQSHVAGAAVAVVRDGKILFSHGYGWADVNRKIPVDPESTLFRIGSNSKVFTWTAVMQLVEQGKIDLNADVNRYLDFHIPDSFARPITMAHLMAHTAGFEDHTFGTEAASANALEPLGQWLRKNLVARVAPPGEVSVYSNCGAALAGYIVQRVSGMSYDEYLEKNLFAPLGLGHITSRQPLPAALAPSLSNAYVYADGEYRPQLFEYLQIAPAGSLSASANDMARFAIAHLAAGAGLLQPGSAERMHSRLFTEDARIDGVAYGMFETTRNGVRAIGHTGGTTYFFTRLLLIPTEKIGFFVAYNTQTARPLVIDDELTNAFFDHYYPAASLKLAVTPDGDAARFAGDYWPMRRSFTTSEKVGLLLDGPLTVREDRGGVAIGSTRFLPLGDRLFRAADGQTALFRPPYALVDGGAFQRVRWFERGGLHWTVLGFCALSFLSVPIGLRHRPRAAWWWALAQGAFFFAYLVTFHYATTAYDVDPRPMMTGTDPLWRALAGVSVVWIPLTAGAVAFALLGWSRGSAGRVHYTVVALAAAAFVWFQAFWKL